MGDRLGKGEKGKKKGKKGKGKEVGGGGRRWERERTSFYNLRPDLLI